MKKRIVAVMISVFAGLILFADGLAAEKPPASGSCGSRITPMLHGGTPRRERNYRTC